MSTYLGSGDASKQRRDYQPEWLDHLADDVTIEASVMNGIALGPDAVRAILGFARTLYDYQEFEYVGPFGEPGDGFAEEYTATVRGEAPIGSVVIVRYNKAGDARQIIINHRPITSVLLWTRLMAEHFAGTEYARYFLTADQIAALRASAADNSGVAA